MSFREAIRTCFAKYVTFSGRASRSEYWWFILFIALGNIGASVVDAAVFDTTPVESELTDTRAEASFDGSGPVAAIFGLAVLVPSISAGWRRMHDSGRSGLYSIYPYIVIVGIGTFAAFAEQMSGLLGGSIDGPVALILGLSLLVLAVSPLLVLWWLTRPSQPGPNQYGPNPHEVTP